MSATASERTRAAASSIASGMPSSRYTSSAMAGASFSVSAKLGLCSFARSTNSCTDVDLASVAISALRIGTGSG